MRRLVVSLLSLTLIVVAGELQGGILLVKSSGSGGAVVSAKPISPPAGSREPTKSMGNGEKKPEDMTDQREKPHVGHPPHGSPEPGSVVWQDRGDRCYDLACAASFFFVNLRPFIRVAFCLGALLGLCCGVPWLIWRVKRRLVPSQLSVRVVLTTLMLTPILGAVAGAIAATEIYAFGTFLNAIVSFSFYLALFTGLILAPFVLSVLILRGTAWLSEMATWIAKWAVRHSALSARVIAR